MWGFWGTVTVYITTHTYIYIYTYNYIEKFHGAVDTAVAVRIFPEMLARLKA